MSPLPADDVVAFTIFIKRPCNRWHQVDLDEFIDAGWGDLNYVNTRFRCKKGGGAAEKQIRPLTMEPVTRHTQETQNV